MKGITKYVLLLFLIIGALLSGILWGRKMEIFKSYEEENSQVMLEKVSKVFKLVAVDAQVSEIYNYKQYRYWDIDMLRKQALVRVKADVSIGYDFEDLEFIVDEEKRSISILGFPDPKILSVDHELDYYDMDEGLFNSFTGDELTEISQKAKEYTVSVINKSELFKTAEEQKDELVHMLEDIFQMSGWKLFIVNERDAIRN